MAHQSDLQRPAEEKNRMVKILERLTRKIVWSEVLNGAARRIYENTSDPQTRITGVTSGLTEVKIYEKGKAVLVDAWFFGRTLQGATMSYKLLHRHFKGPKWIGPRMFLDTTGGRYQWEVKTTLTPHGLYVVKDAREST